MHRLAFGLLLWCAFSTVGLAAGPPAEPLLRVVAYDRNLRAKAPNGLRLGIVFAASNRDSIVEAERFLEEVESLRRKRSPVAPVFTVKTAFESAESLYDWCQTNELSAIYVAPGLEEALRHLAAVAAAAGVLTLGASAGDVQTTLAVGLETRQSAEKPIINLQSARDCGADFQPTILQIAVRAGTPPDPSSLKLLDEIGETLELYGRALEGQSLDALREVWPDIGDEEAGRVAASFSFIKSQETFFAVLRVQRQEQRILARVRRADIIATVDGKKQHAGALAEFEFRRGVQGWVIASMKKAGPIDAANLEGDHP